MNGTQVENNKPNEVDDEANQPILHSPPSPDAFMPRPTRPFPISSRDENPKRGNWWNKIEFIFGCIALCCNGSAFFTFPFRVVIYGGGIFLVLFVLAMILFAFPYIVLEMALGQFSSSGIISVWNFSPLLKGFGVIAALTLALHNVLTNVSSTYHLLYAFFTIKHSVEGTPLPWLGCSHPWNTPNCYDSTTMNASMASHETWNSVANSAWQNSQQVSEYIPRDNFSPAREFFRYELYNRYDAGLTSIGSLNPSLVFALLATWGFILALSCMGAKWTGKVAYFIVPISVILLFTLLMRGATLPGAHEGLIFLLAIDRSVFTRTELWQQAFSEAFYASFMGLGVYIALSSYNKFRNNICLDAVFVVTATVVFKIMVVLIVGTFCGFYSYHAGVPFGHVLDIGDTGLGLTLTTFPSIMGALPAANAWTCVFFITLFLLFTSSSIFMVQALLTTLLDLFHLPHSVIFLLPTSGIICVLSFLVSLPMVTEGGFGVFQFLDLNTAHWGAYVVAAILPFASMWVYGVIPKWDFMRLPREIQKMVGFFPVPFQVIFLLFWAAIIPLAAGLCFFKNLYDFQYFPGILSNENWMDYVFLGIGLLPLLVIPVLVGICQLLKKRSGYLYFTQLFWKAAQPSDDWGPPVELHRRQVGYRTIPKGQRRQLNSSEIHFNPATNSPTVILHDPSSAYPPPHRQFSPPPPSYNDYPPGQTSPGSDKNLSPAPSSVGSGLPSIYPSPLAGAGQSVSPATVSATDTLDSNRRYPPASVDYTAGAQTDFALSEPEDSPFVNISSHETTL